MTKPPGNEKYVVETFYTYKCPSCDKYTFKFDSYFSRYRCLQKGCGYDDNRLVIRNKQVREVREFMNLVKTLKELGVVE